MAETGDSGDVNSPDAPRGSDGDGDGDVPALTPSLKPQRPLVAATVIALGALIVFRLAGDLHYAMSAPTPTVIQPTTPSSALTDDTFVQLSGQPDRRNALYLAPRGAKTAQLLFRLLGSDSRLFVKAVGSSGRDDLKETWVGRLRKFDALPYADTLRDHYKKNVHARRYLALDGLWAGLRASPPRVTEVKDRLDRALGLSSDREVELALAFPDQLRILLPRNKYPSEDDAKHEIERLGFHPTVVAEGDAYHYAVLIAAPLVERNAIMEKLGKQEDAKVMLRDMRAKVRLDKLAVAGDDLVVPGDLGLFFAVADGGTLQRSTHIALAAVQAVSIDEPVLIPADAFILIEDESPRALWWVPVVGGMAVLFVLFNVWYLIRSLRRQDV